MSSWAATASATIMHQMEFRYRRRIKCKKPELTQELLFSTQTHKMNKRHVKTNLQSEQQATQGWAGRNANVRSHYTKAHQD